MSDTQSLKVCASCNQTNDQTATFCQVCGSQFVKTNFINFDSAKANLEQQLTNQNLTEQEQARLNMQIAVLHLRREEANQATQYLRRAVALDENNALAHAYLGAALAEEYIVEEAQTELEKALELNSQDAVVQLKMAEFKLMVGLTIDAAHHLELAYKLPAPSRETATYIANLLVTTRKRNQASFERRNFLPSFKGFRFLPRPKVRTTVTKIEVNPS